jgi:hypothetical protein
LTIAICQVLTLFGDEGGDVDQADDVIRFRRGICGARPAVGVADGNHRTWYLLKQAGDIGGVGGDSAQRIGLSVPVGSDMSALFS